MPITKKTLLKYASEVNPALPQVGDYLPELAAKLEAHYRKQWDKEVRQPKEEVLAVAAKSLDDIATTILIKVAAQFAEQEIRARRKVMDTPIQSILGDFMAVPKD
jgi:hypothetical protein